MDVAPFEPASHESLASGSAFLYDGFRLCKPGGILHFYSLVSKENEYHDRIHELGGEIIAERVVRSYSPGQWHVVYDVRAGEK